MSREMLLNDRRRGGGGGGGVGKACWGRESDRVASSVARSSVLMGCATGSMRVQRTAFPLQTIVWPQHGENG
jgi:hypothetical protein